MLFRSTRLLLILLLFAILVGIPFGYSRYRQSQFRNLRVVEPGKLYRSGQMSLDALQSTIKEYRIKTVLSLRYPDQEGEPAPDFSEEEFCNANGIRFVRIRPRHWYDIDNSGSIPADRPVNEFLELMDDPSVYPVLIHCFAGKHRTGAFCAVYRMEYQRWSNEEALHELKALGYDKLDSEDDVRGYLTNYQPRWKRREP